MHMTGRANKGLQIFFIACSHPSVKYNLNAFTCLPCAEWAGQIEAYMYDVQLHAAYWQASLI